MIIDSKFYKSLVQLYFSMFFIIYEKFNFPIKKNSFNKAKSVSHPFTIKNEKKSRKSSLVEELIH